MDRWLIDIIEEIQTSNGLAEIKTILVKVKEYLGFDNVLYGIKQPETFTQSSALIISDYPFEWLKRYGEQGYVNIDPVAQHCFSSQIPYPWSGFKKHAKKKEIFQFVGEAGEFKLRDGISVGMPRFDGEAGLISLSTDKVLMANSDRIIIYLNAIQPFIHERICQMSGKAQYKNMNVDLTEREKTCLLWVAEGKTAYDISVILSISEATVVFHLKNAIQKLDVTNRSQAIAKAVLLGLIVPQFPLTSVPTYHF